MIEKTTNIVLHGASLIYFFAFFSLYHQVPGLYSDGGILPVNNFLKQFVVKDPINSFLANPTLLIFCKGIGITVYDGLEILCLSGTVLSAFMVLFKKLRNVFSFLALYVFYLSCYKVGQTFLSFQWDIMLLEFGVICIVTCIGNQQGLFLMRWLLLRLLFHSGYKKLESGCNTWWSLTALDWHFESQCIPTPLGFHFHHFPRLWLKFGVVITYITQLGVSLLNLSPNRRLRIFGGWCHILHQTGIMATGNYNFFNLLTILISLASFDDEHIDFLTGSAKKEKKKNSSCAQIIYKMFTLTVEAAQIGILIYVVHLGIDFDFETPDVALKETAEDQSKLKNYMLAILKPSIILGGFHLLWSVCLDVSRNYVGLATSVLSVLLFSVSIVPFCDMDRSFQQSLPSELHRLRSVTNDFQLAHSYGLFRRMTGVGGRPEVVVEAATNAGSWSEIEFLYKPTNLARACPWCLPHQPRLDWQMWFAALGRYDHNPWLLNFAYRILTQEQNTIKLIDKKKFEEDFLINEKYKIKYIRMWHYTYSYTKKGESYKTWTRKNKREYLPTVSLEHDGFMNFVKENGLQNKKQVSTNSRFLAIEQFLRKIRSYSEMFQAEVAIWTFLIIFLCAHLL